MKTIPAALAAHLAGDATTTCLCWRLTRRDGLVQGFTEHDRDLVVDGTRFEAASGFAASEREAETGLAAATEDVRGGFSSAAISEADLAAGRYDGAGVECLLVNWAEPTQYMRLNLREVGEVSRAGGAFSAELRSLAHRLDQPQGRVYARRCDAAFGDVRCGIDRRAWQADATVVEMRDRNRIVVDGLQGQPGGTFDRGTLSTVLPSMAAVAADIETQVSRADGLSVLTLWLPLAEDLPAGTVLTLTAGCDKRFATCRSRFANALNFRGFPHVPGADFAYSYVDGERDHDGGALFD